MKARSWLYVPAHEERKISKAATSDADVVILDLEDATPADRKDAGRMCARAALLDEDFGRSRRYVRINPIGSPEWRADVDATLTAGVDGYVLPKASSPAAVQALAEAVRSAGRPVPLAPILTEDVAGVFAAGETASSDDLVTHILWGSEDLSASLGAWRVKDEAGEFLDPFVAVRALVLLQAARYGRRAIDTPFLTIGDIAGLRRQALRAAWMGYAGAQAIHPEQVPILNEAFVPSEDELRAARELMEAFVAGAAIVRVGDAMADNPHLLRARNISALGESE